MIYSEEPMQQENISLKEDNQDIKKILSLLIDNWYWFLLSIIICLIVARIYLRYATPMYKVDATVLVEDPQKGGSSTFSQVSNTLQDFSSLFDTKSSVDNEAQILQTRDLMKKVVADLQLYITYYNHGKIKDAELYNKLPVRAEVLTPLDSIGSARIDILKAEGSGLKIRERANNFDNTYDIVFNRPFATHAGIIKLSTTQYAFNPKISYSIVFSPVSQVVEGLHSISVDIPNKQVTTINLELKTSLPKKGEDILNTMIKDYIRDNIEQKNAFADSTIAFIDGRLLVVNNELSSIENGVEAFKTFNHIADISEQTKQVLDNSADYIKEQNQAAVQEQIIETMLRYVLDSKNNKRPVPSLIINPDPTFLVLLDKYNNLLLQRDRLTLGSTDKNPLVINLDQQISNARKDLVSSLRNQLSGVQIDRQRLQSQNRQLNSFISSVPAKERQFLDLSRQQEIKQDLFVFLLQKKEEVAITKASNIASARLIDSPKANTEPYSPKKSMILLGALAAGMLFPFGLISIKRSLNYKLSDIDEIRELINVPVIGDIIHNKNEELLVYIKKKRSVIAEQFRILRTNLQFAVQKEGCSVILFTSSMNGEGKSFIALNLGLACASANKKILLMELDLRKPKIADHLKIKHKEGFSNYIASNIPVDKIILPSGVDDNLDIITSGVIPPNPAELLSSPKVKALLDEMKKKYDVILLDSPPIGMVTDARLLAPYADSVLYVIRYDYTYKQQMNIINDIQSSGKIQHLYAVLNDVKLKNSHIYSGYGYGNYDGFEDDDKTNNKWWVKIRNRIFG